MKLHVKTLLTALICAMTLAAVSTANAQNGTWINNGSAAWNVGTNWSGGIIASGQGNTALFNADLTDNRTVTLGADRTIGNITFTDDSHNLTISGNTLTFDVVSGASVVDVSSGRNLIFTSALAGNDQITKTGVGQMQFNTGTNNITGALRIEGGTVLTGATANLGTIPEIILDSGTFRMTSTAVATIDKPVTITENGGTLSKGGSSANIHTYNQAFTISGTGNRTLTLDASSGGNGRLSSALANPSSGALSLTKTGAGTWDLTVANTYTGATTISAGTLSMASNLIASSSKISIAGGATLAHSAGASANFLLASGQDIEGTGTGTATFNTGNNAFNGLVTASDTIINHTGVGTLALQRLEIRGTGNEMTGGNVTSGVANTRRGLLVGNLDNGTFTISGGTFTSNGGTSTDVIGTTGGTGTFNISGGNYVNAGTLSIGLGATTSFGGTMNINSGSATIGTLIYNSEGTGNQGITNLNGGSLTVGTLTSTAGATRQFNFNGGQFIAGGAVTFDATLDLNVQNGGANINTNDNNVAVNAPLDNAGAGGLVKSGPGTLTLDGINTYIGATAINGGTLTLGAAGSIANTAMINVAAGATLNVSAVGGGWSVGAFQTLGGNGTVVGATTINGTLAPGNSPGVLSFADTLSLDGVTIMEIDGDTRGTEYDGVDTGDGLIYGGLLEFDFGTVFAPDTYTFDLFNIVAGGESGDFLSVTLTGAYTGALAPIGGGVWQRVDSGNTWTFDKTSGDLTFIAVPEPATIALLGAGVAFLGFRLARRRKA